MDIIASVEAGDMRYSVAERQADDTQPFLGIEEAIMPQVDSLEIPITVSIVYTLPLLLHLCQILLLREFLNHPTLRIL